MADEVAFRQLFCRAVRCGVMFFICRACYRGQAYCSDECRRQSRDEQLRKANRRYQQDPEVREDHCERMREYRRRVQASRVILEVRNRRYWKKDKTRRQVRQAAIMRTHYRTMREKMQYY